MIRTESLRWVLLPAAVVAGLLCALGTATPARIAFFGACSALWYWLSRRKVFSLDRETLGIPRRRAQRR
jgi:membrane protein implicated in regulation of membrane protease activity